MNAQTGGVSRDAAPSRLTRGVAVLAVGAALAAGLSACQTVRANDYAGPPVYPHTLAPAYTDARQPADRVERQITARNSEVRARSERFAGIPADRVAQQFGEELPVVPGTAAGGGAGTVNPYPGLPADRVEHLLG